MISAFQNAIEMDQKNMLVSWTAGDSKDFGTIEGGFYCLLATPLGETSSLFDDEGKTFNTH